jgi:LysM repeat protein
MRYQKTKKPLALFAFISLALALALTGCLGREQAKAIKSKQVSPAYSLNQQKVNQILKTAFSQIGNPYRYGGNSPETGFDCSGFVGWVYKQYGVSLPRSSRDMLGAGIPISRDELRPGDLVFFNYGYSHVGIYTGDDKYIHSPRTGKRVEEVNLSAKGRGDHFVGARRVIDNVGVNAISDRMKGEWIAQSRHQTDLALRASAGEKHSASPARPLVALSPTASKLALANKPGSASSATKNMATSAATKTTTKKAVAKKPGGQKKVTHKVAPGDNLVTLAKRFGLSSNDIALANNLKDKNKLKPGQTLIIPEKSKNTAVAKNKATKKKAPATKAKAKAKPKTKAKT